MRGWQHLQPGPEPSRHISLERPGCKFVRKTNANLQAERQSLGTSTSLQVRGLCNQRGWLGYDRCMLLYKLKPNRNLIQTKEPRTGFLLG